jgi:hypothetical protein
MGVEVGGTAVGVSVGDGVEHAESRIIPIKRNANNPCFNIFLKFVNIEISICNSMTLLHDLNDVITPS